MSGPRTHQVTTSDGVVLAGSVHGEGPPLVLWHGAFGDGDLDWRPLLPHLGRFTCHTPGWRGRGRSEDSPMLGYERRVDDVVAYVESLGEPTALLGWSGSGNLVLAAAARSDAVAALVVVEPTMGAVMDDEDRAAFVSGIGGMRELAAAGRLPEALRAGAGWPMSGAEIAALEDMGYFDAAAAYVPNLLEVFRQLAEWDGPTADDPDVLGAISVPVLVLHGSQTKPFWIRCAHYVADHVGRAAVQAIPGAGHAAPLTHPTELAEQLDAFLADS